jgi:hypothetical protein
MELSGVGRKYSSMLNALAGCNAVERLGSVVAVVCLIVAAAWVSKAFDPADAARQALWSALPWSLEAEYVPVSLACQGVTLGVLVRLFSRSVLRWLFRGKTGSRLR